MMKQIAFRFSLVSLLVIGAFSLAQASNPATIDEYIKEYHEEFSITPDGTVSITNKYGRVDMNSWSKNYVKIDVVILVKSGSASRAEDMLETINVAFENGRDFVQATTTIESKKKWWKRSSGKESFEINYMVYAPTTNEIRVKNSYGDTHIGRFANDAHLDIAYGSVAIDHIDGDVTAEIDYSKATLQEVDDLTLDMAYSKLKGTRVGDFVAQTKYSKVYLDEVGDMEVQSKYDEFHLGRIGRFKNVGKYDDFFIEQAHSADVQSKYTDVRITHLEKVGNFGMKYGSIKIKSISPAFSELDIESKYTGIGLLLDQPYHLLLDTEYVDVHLPDDFRVISKEKERSELRIEGHYGQKSSDDSASIEILMQYGTLLIKG